VLALVLVSASLGIGNFVAAVSMSLHGVDNKLRLKIGVVFGIFEGGMPAIGLILGHSLSHTFGSFATPLGGGLLAVVGAVNFVKEYKKSKSGTTDERAGDQLLMSQSKSIKGFGKLILTGAVLALDNLVVGFALGDYKVSVLLAVVTIGSVSAAMSLLGLETGRLVGKKIGEYGELLSSAVLIAVGILIGTGYL
jgi:putative Mn2+ efflux pump MntP